MKDEDLAPATGEQPSPLAHLEVSVPAEIGPGEDDLASEAQPAAASPCVELSTSDTPVKRTYGGAATPRARIKIILRKVEGTASTPETHTSDVREI
jgi:hypothetical protein